MANPHAPEPGDTPDDDESAPACVLVFNAGDPSGAGGIGGDVLSIAAVGAHPLPVTCGAYIRDTTETLDHFAMDDECVAEQARSVVEDITCAAIKAGFLGTPENVSAVAQVASDYAETPLVTYMPNLSWRDEPRTESYLDACRELLLPLTTVLVGNHSTLWRWLLPDWEGERPPGARDIAAAAAELGAPYTLVTGALTRDGFVENTLASPQAVLCGERFERFEATFTGAGDTLSAVLTALLACGHDLPTAATEALGYLDRCLDSGFRPGMGHVIPDRMFWAQGEGEPDPDADADADDPRATPRSFGLHPHDTKH